MSSRNNTDAPAFLGVTRSLTGRRWIARPHDERLAQALSQRFDLPELVGRILAARGVDLDGAESFLDPTLRDLLPDPSCLKDMNKAAERIAAAVMTGEALAIFGDYDVDGATSTALLLRFLRAAGGIVTHYIPDRLTEGYGPNAPALLHLKEMGVSVVVTVDCGITAFAALEAAAEAGLDVVVVDHHEAEARMPRAFAVVNPNRLDEDRTLGHMAAVGVAFLLAVAVNRTLRARGWFTSERVAPDPLRLLDLVALGTVCDVVPLRGINRALVRQGLKVLARRANPGLTALADVAGVKEQAEAYHLGFVLGPRVNAGGRVGGADLGARLLSCDDPVEAAELARKLNEHNSERQQIEQMVLQDAMERLESTGADEAPLVFVAGEGWHPGVIGIVAGRLKERYNRPVCVVALENGIGKGSGRSVPGVDLGAAVIAARQAGLLVNGGGHVMAAGFTVAADKLDELSAFLAERVAANQDGTEVPIFALDGALDIRGATHDLAAQLAKVGPFGSGNAEPRFALSRARILKADVVGQGHVRCVLTGASGGRLKAIAFRCADSDLGFALLNAAGGVMHLAGTLQPDNWQGREDIQMFIEDAAPAASD